jgi:CRISPR-associated endonuclease/helicase Cas3
VPRTELTAAHYSDFVGELFDRAPFPWQQRLVDQVLDTGVWPAVIDVPTGLGKTSLIDIGVFVTAATVRHPPLKRPGRRRLFFVIDRRVIVDQAHEHAQQVAAKLAEATQGSVARRIADQLRSLAGLEASEAPLSVTRMRGGVTWGWRWLTRADQPAVIVGTVDQIGSRFLFRGYGVGENLRSIDAALVGTDSLILIDEAHLAEPFVRTLDDALSFDGAALPLARPVMVTMSATPGAIEGDAFSIDRNDRADPVAKERLTARKTAHLVELANRDDAAISALLARIALSVTGDDIRVIGAIVNTVSRARAVFDELLGALGPDRVVLLTGRVRPIDRDQLLATWLPRLSIERDRNTDADPIFMVATQTVEVGANIDLDALVTESTALDALVQRLGRLNRLGKQRHATAIIVHRPTQDDPIYGSARFATWEWLARLADPVTYKKPADVDTKELGEAIDVSPHALGSLLRRQSVTHLIAPRPLTPVLFPTTLDAWVRTSPAPLPDTPVGPFLHGIDRDQPTLSVVWRADLNPDHPDAWIDTVALLAPVSEEAVEIPLYAARDWLTGAAVTAPFGDAGSIEPDPSERDDNGHMPRSVLRYCGRDDLTITHPRELRPGDLIVCPARYGGLDDYGWSPASTEPVLDVADLASRRDRPALRLGSATLMPIINRDAPELADDVTGVLRQLNAELANPDTDANEAVIVALRTLHELLTAQPTQSAALRAIVEVTKRRDLRITIPEPAQRAPLRPSAVVRASFATDADDSSALASSLTGQPVTLAQHLVAVRDRATRFAVNMGLPDSLATIAAQAAAYHDLGKLDPRFQAMLHGGDHLAAEVAAEPLAKSGMDPNDRFAFQRAQQRSRYPSGMRHEAASAQALRAAATTLDTTDLDLLLHLVASHHGRSRPLLPPTTDTASVTYTVAVDGTEVEIDSGHGIDWTAPRRFEDLNHRYGRWGLALLETIVRLADIACSEEGT